MRKSAAASRTFVRRGRSGCKTPACSCIRSRATSPGAPRSARPMHRLFDTWKAWPKPTAYTLTGAGADVGTPPSHTYPEVEKQVSAQVDRIAFFGVEGIAGFRDLRDFVGRAMRSGVSR